MYVPFDFHRVRSRYGAWTTGWTVRVSNLGRGKKFLSKLSKLALGSTHLPAESVLGYSPRDKAVGA
jgi:hypothetical protein